MGRIGTALHSLSPPLLAFLCLICCGCVRPGIQTWRLVRSATTQVLVPPDVAKPDLAQRTLKVRITRGSVPCPPDIEDIALKVRRKGATVRVATQSLSRQPAGGLASW